MGRLAEKINYVKINESNKEFRRSDYWLIEITAPKGIYFPGNDLIQVRTNQFSPGINDDVEILSKQIRTFTVKQGAKTTDTSGTMTLTLTDRVDQTISYFIDKWKLAVGQRDELSGLSKDLYIAPTIKAMYFNINEEKIREITFLNCIIHTGSLPEDGSGEPAIEDDISIGIDYEHFYRSFKNLPLV